MIITTNSGDNSQLVPCINFNWSYITVSELSLRLSSPLATPTVVPPTGSVETAQPIRTMAIIIEVGDKEEGDGWGKHCKDEGKEEEEEGAEEVEEGQEQLEVSDSPFSRLV